MIDKGVSFHAKGIGKASLKSFTSNRLPSTCLRSGFRIIRRSSVVSVWKGDNKYDKESSVRDEGQGRASFLLSVVTAVTLGYVIRQHRIKEKGLVKDLHVQRSHHL